MSNEHPNGVGASLPMAALSLGEPEDEAQARKAFANRAAPAASLGIALWRTDSADGPVRYVAMWGGMTRIMADLAEVDALLERVAGAASADR